MIIRYILIPLLAIAGTFMIMKAPAIKAFYEKKMFVPRLKFFGDATELAAIRFSGAFAIVMAILLFLPMW